MFYKYEVSSSNTISSIVQPYLIKTKMPSCLKELLTWKLKKAERFKCDINKNAC